MSTSPGEPGVGTEAPGSGGALPSVYLHPGQLFASAEPAWVTTVLGSCVSACLWDRDRGIGGINHFVLPIWAGNGTSSPRFGNVAMEALLARLVGLGAHARDVEAKVFGGACMIQAFRRREHHLGGQNVDRALAFLHERGVPISSQDTGGNRGRKLIFHTATGAAWLKEL
jgi:chemotaxis protein CheD